MQDKFYQEVINAPFCKLCGIKIKTEIKNLDSKPVCRCCYSKDPYKSKESSWYEDNTSN